MSQTERDNSKGAKKIQLETKLEGLVVQCCEEKERNGKHDKEKFLEAESEKKIEGKNKKESCFSKLALNENIDAYYLRISGLEKQMERFPWKKNKRLWLFHFILKV